MTETNVFAPPKSNLDGAPGPGEQAPPLWNPNAAASWSLLLSSAFGAYLHMRNWRALGEHRLADQARIWMAVSIGVLVLTIFFGTLTGAGYGIGRLISFSILIAWYFVGAKAQVREVKERFGDAYPRKGWLLPLVLGFLILCAAAFSIAFAAAFIRIAAGAR